MRSKLDFAVCFSCCNCIFWNCLIRSLIVFCEISCKFGQGNGAIAACWQAKAGVEPPFAGCGRPFFLRARSSIVSYKQQSCNCSGGTIAMRDVLRETTRIRFGKAGAHPQLALGIAIAPETLSFITTFLI